MKLNVSHLALLGLAMPLVPATQAAPAAPPAKSNTDTLIDARPNIVVRSVDLTKIDTLTNPGTLFLIK